MHKQFFLFFALLTISSLWANPQNGKVVSGQASFKEIGKTLQIEASNKAIINWRDFSIKHGETTKFVMPDSLSKVLNRVTGSQMSKIMGDLICNGHIYLVNPNGILVGPNGKVDVAGCVFSTLDVHDELFKQANSELIFKGNTKEGIINLGTIKASDGDIALISFQVTNEGNLLSPLGSVYLTSANDVLLKPSGDDRIFIRAKINEKEKSDVGIDQKGNIDAMKAYLQANGNPYEVAIKHSGKTKTLGIKEKNGKFYLFADEGNAKISGEISSKNENAGGEINIFGNTLLVEEASLDVSHPNGGGEILIGGDLHGKNPNIKNASYVYVDEKSFITASAIEEGNGGKIIVWSDEKTQFYGSACAKGGKIVGDGGLIEISGKILNYKPKVSPSTLANNGNVGQLLLDPSDIDIGNYGGAGSSNPTFPQPPATAGSYNPGPSEPVPCQLDVVDLMNALASNDVIVSTGNGDQGVGNIRVLFPFSWASGNTLTLQSNNNLNVNAVVEATGLGSIVVLARGNVQVNAASQIAAIKTNSGSIRITGQNVSVLGGNDPGEYAEISSKTGNTIFPSINSLTLTGGNKTGTYAQIGVGSSTGILDITSDIIFQTFNGNLSLTGGSGASSYAQIGHAPFGVGNATVNSDITFSTIQGNVILTGGSSSDTSAIIGHGNELSTTLSSIQGDISITSHISPILTAGNNNVGSNRSHAIIGFQTSTSGVGATIQSNKIDVQSTIMGDLQLTGGHNSFAVIGYYQPNAVAGNNVEITDINITVVSVPQVVLNANDTVLAGRLNGAAIIGTLDSFSSAKSNINIQSGDIFLNGPIGGNSGVARIINNNNNPTPISAPFDVNINITGGSFGITLVGGVGQPPQFVDIYSSRNINIDGIGAGQDFLINRIPVPPAGLTPQNGYAHVVAYDSVSINANTRGRYLALAGGILGADALLQAINGNVSIGSTLGGGFSGLVVGDPTSLAPSKILAKSATSYMDVSGVNNAVLYGGAGDDVIALIESTEGKIDFYALDLSIIGGTSNRAYAQIDCLQDDLSFTIGNDLNVTGGSGASDKAYAQIGKGLVTTETSINSNIIFHQIGNQCNVTGGSASNAYAQIGHAPHTGTSTVNVISDIDFKAIPIGDTLTLTGGSATNCTAIIGYGNELSADLGNCKANILNFEVLEKVTLQAGSVPQTHAIIGFHNPTGGSSSAFNVNSDTGISLYGINDGIDLIATYGSNATIGYYNANDNNSQVIVQLIDVNDSLRDINLYAGDDSGTNAGYAVIGTSGVNSSVTQSNIQIVGGTVYLHGPTFPAVTDNGAARIINNYTDHLTVYTSADFDIAITALNLKLQGGTTTPLGGNPYGYADIYSSKNINMSISQDHYLNADSLPAIDQTGFAHEVAYNNIIINQGVAGQDMSMAGGTVYLDGGLPPLPLPLYADALVESRQGQVSLGSFGNGGMQNLYVGNVNSLAPSRIITYPGQNSVNVTNDMILQGGADDYVVALIQTDSGDFYVSANDLTLNGGGPVAPPPPGKKLATAEIRSRSGDGTISAFRDLILNGATIDAGNSLCYAQISSYQGSVNFSNIGRDLQLNGGNGVLCYAQIGSGYLKPFPPPNPAPAAPSDINSNISIDLIGRDLTIRGSTAVTGQQAYVQIGHSPFWNDATITTTIPVTGDVIISSVLNEIALHGGAAQSTTAVIGHGNDFTKDLSKCSGNIDVTCNGPNGIVLIPGAPALDTHTTIGFHSPHDKVADNNTFRVSSDLVSVKSLLGPIVINYQPPPPLPAPASYGDRTNATIGYYNATTKTNAVPKGVVLSIEEVHVEVDITDLSQNRIDVFAGNSGAVFPFQATGISSIGTYVADGNDASSTVKIVGNALNVIGPSGTFNGAARIINNRYPVFLNYPVNLDMNHIVVRGNVGLPPAGPNGFAEIYSSGKISCNYAKTMNVGWDPTSPATLQNNNTLIDATNDLEINKTKASTGNFQIVGGSNGNVITRLNSWVGNIIWGDKLTTTRGGNDIIIGRADQFGAADIYTTTGSIDVFANRDLKIVGSNAGFAGYSQLYANSDNTVQMGRDVIITGASIANMYPPRIGAANGTIKVLALRDVLLTGNTSGSTIVVEDFFTSGDLSVTAAGNLTMLPNTKIENLTNGKISCEVKKSITMTGAAGLEAAILGLNSGEITIIAGVDMTMNDFSRIQSNTVHSMAIVCDEKFPSVAAGIGPGRFIKSNGAIIQNGGPVRIFTAQREQNNVNGAINGTIYVPGIEYVNTDTEKWGYYYFVPLGGTPFTIFYKYSNPFVPPAIIVHIKSFSEWIQDLRVFDRFIPQMLWMKVKFDLPDLKETRFYHIIRRQYQDFHREKFLMMDMLNPYKEKEER